MVCQAIFDGLKVLGFFYRRSTTLATESAYSAGKQAWQRLVDGGVEQGLENIEVDEVKLIDACQVHAVVHPRRHVEQLEPMPLEKVLVRA